MNRKCTGRKWIFVSGKAYNELKELHMIKRLALVLTLLSLVVLGSACLIAMLEYPGGEYPPIETFKRFIDFPSGSNFSIRSFDGNIEISGWGEQSLEIYAEKQIVLPEGAQVSLWSRDWNIHGPKIEFEYSDIDAVIKTRSPNPEGEDCVVDYFISVPHEVSLRDIVARDGDVLIRDLYGEVGVDLRNGEIEVDNFSGSLTASVREGSIRATLYDLRETDMIRLTSRSGDITLFLEADASVDLDCACPKGEVSMEFDSQVPVEDGRLKVRLEKGGASISLSALDGDVRVYKLKESGDPKR